MMAGTTGLEPATSAVTGQRSNQLSYVPSFFSSTCTSLRICCLSMPSIFSPASTFSTESNRFPRLMDSTDSMKHCRQCCCRRPATQNICPCPVFQIVPNKSISEEMDKALRQGLKFQIDNQANVGGKAPAKPTSVSSRSTRSNIAVDEVAVGTIIADRPPHRSARALISACGSYLG